MGISKCYRSIIYANVDLLGMTIHGKINFHFHTQLKLKSLNEQSLVQHCSLAEQCLAFR